MDSQELYVLIQFLSSAIFVVFALPLFRDLIYLMSYKILLDLTFKRLAVKCVNALQRYEWGYMYRLL